MVLPLPQGQDGLRDTLPRQSPPYWSQYAFVDINRDAHQQVHETTKAVHRMFHEWHPTVVHDLHESVAAAADLERHRPLQPQHRPHHASANSRSMSFHEVTGHDRASGMPGVSTWNFGEGFRISTWIRSP